MGFVERVLTLGSRLLLFVCCQFSVCLGNGSRGMRRVEVPFDTWILPAADSSFQTLLLLLVSLSLLIIDLPEEEERTYLSATSTVNHLTSVKTETNCLTISPGRYGSSVDRQGGSNV